MATYTVKKGDSLIDLAKKFGVSASSLLAANPGVRSINPGVTLRVPTTESYTGPAAPGSGPAFGGSPRPGVPTPQPPPYTGPAPPGSGPARGGSPRPGVPTKPAPTQPRPTPDPFRPGVPTQPQPPPPRAITPAPFDPRAIPQTPAQQPGFGPGYIPAAYQAGQRFAQQIWPNLQQDRVQDYLKRLFYIERPRRITDGQYFSPNLAPWAHRAASDLERSLESVRETLPRTGSLATRLATIPLAVLREMGQAAAPEYIAGGPSPYTSGREEALMNARLDQLGLGVQDLSGKTHYYVKLDDLGNVRDADGKLVPLDEDTAADIEIQFAENTLTIMEGGARPKFLSRREQLLIGFSDEQMQEMGYAWDAENEQWILGEIIGPQGYGAAAPYGYGYSPRYRRGYGGGRGGGGGGGYTYPSRLPGEPYQYPQSFVERQQRGLVPEQARNRPARFGAVTWRI